MNEETKTREELEAELTAVRRELLALREVVDSIPHRVFWKDRNSVWLGGNRNFARDCNVASPRDLVGRTDHDFFAKEQADFFQRCDREVMDRGEALLEIEEPQDRPDGSMNYLLTSKVPFRDPRTNEVIGLVGTYIDITERKRLAGELQQALTAAKAAAEAKSRFLAVVSHELRTPLALIIGPIEALASRVPDALREDVAMVHRNALRLKDLVDDVLDLSRLEAGKLSAQIAVCDVGALVEMLARDAAEAARLRELDLRADVGAIAPFDTDGALVQKMVLNLVGNAIKFTPSGGTITVSVRARGEDAVEIAVADSGPGIAPEQQKRLFQRFEQADATRTRAAEGTGLGLALVKEFAEVLGGSVELQSSPGEGSTFRIRLPVRRALGGLAEAVTPTASQKLHAPNGVDVVERAGTRGVRVVVAEDNPDMRRLLRTTLEPHCILTLCSNGRLALEAVLAERPDVVLSDVMMPVMDGLELTRRIRENEALRATPVILLTARAGVTATAEGLDAGADDYVTKPFHDVELVARIRAAARAHAILRELGAQQSEIAKVREVVDQRRASSRTDSQTDLRDAMSILDRVSSRLNALTKTRPPHR